VNNYTAIWQTHTAPEGLFYPANRFTLCDDFLNDTGIFAEVFVYKDEVAQFVIVSAAVGVEHVFGDETVV